MRRVFPYTALLLPVAAHASFNAAPCTDIGCHLVMLGMVSLVGVPVFGTIFAVLHMAFCHPERSQLKQGIVGVVAGVIAFGLCAAAMVLMATWGQTKVGHNQSYPWIGLISMFLVCAVVSALYARSSPHGSHGA